MPNHKTYPAGSLLPAQWAAVRSWLRRNPDVATKAELAAGVAEALGKRACNDALLCPIVHSVGNDHQCLLVDLT